MPGSVASESVARQQLSTFQRGAQPAEQELVPGGLPDNVLTDSRGGVLPYCNEEPTQETISGVDTDWHYCEETGRVFASAGFSGEATLNW